LDILSFEFTGIEEVRVDKFLESACEDFSRSYIQKLIKDSLVKINGKVIRKNGFKLKEGDIIELSVPLAKDSGISPTDLNLDIIYEDKDYMIINKPSGLIVHPGAGARDCPTLVHGVMHAADNLSAIGGEKRPGIVHRLDKGTSGIIMVCKNDKAHKYYSEKFKNREMEKVYLAFVFGSISKSGKIESEIGRHPKNRIKMISGGNNARSATTLFSLIEDYRYFSLVEARPKTGRTHQIRVHLSENGNPLLGDEIYTDKNIENNIVSELKGKNNFLLNVIKMADRLMLHSSSLKFIDQKGNMVSYNAPTPEKFEEIMTFLKKHCF
jgi:23S rRNA pseudouridine1911/1915/1917 synthase